MTICWRGVRRVALWNLVGAVGGTVAFSSLTWETPWSKIVADTGIGLMFSLCISSLCWAVLPRLGPLLLGRVTGALYWAAMTIAMFALAVLGSVIAIMALSTIGYIDTGVIVRSLRSSLRVSIGATLAIGIAVTMLQRMRGQLERTTIALRTKERDEADARRLAAEAQRSSLESRVQPHFLFNTLNSIAALIPQDPAGAERMTGQLASLLRSSLDGGSRPLASLEEELRIVRDYLDIEQVRFGPRLRYEIRVEVDAERSDVPRFALQTLVENSVKYAVAPRREGGTILIAARHSATGLDLEVADDGPGFDAEAGQTEGHGLALVRDRLRLTFGDHARLVIDARPGATRVSIHIEGP